jgi:hypothetical protein
LLVREDGKDGLGKDEEQRKSEVIWRESARLRVAVRSCGRMVGCRWPTWLHENEEMQWRRSDMRMKVRRDE